MASRGCRATNIRLGNGAADVVAAHTGATLHDHDRRPAASALRTLRIGHTLPRGAKVATVKLDGKTITSYDGARDQPRRRGHGGHPPGLRPAHAGRHRRLNEIRRSRPLGEPSGRLASTSVWAMPDVTLEQLDADPHPVLARLRASEPVAWVPALGGWLVTRRDLALQVMRDAGGVHGRRPALLHRAGRRAEHALDSTAPSTRATARRSRAPFRLDAVRARFTAAVRGGDRPAARRARAAPARPSCGAASPGRWPRRP